MTKNMPVSELPDHDEAKAMHQLMMALNEGRQSGEAEGYIPSSEVRERLKRRVAMKENEKRIPPDVPTDPFYSAAYQRDLADVIARIDSGEAKFVEHDLIDLKE